VFIVAFLRLPTDLGQLSRQAAHPGPPHGEDWGTYWFFAVALFASALTPYEVFSVSSGAVEERWTAKELVAGQALPFLRSRPYCSPCPQHPRRHRHPDRRLVILHGAERAAPRTADLPRRLAHPAAGRRDCGAVLLVVVMSTQLPTSLLAFRLTPGAVLIAMLWGLGLLLRRQFKSIEKSAVQLC
jgi:hypothetical protein